MAGIKGMKGKNLGGARRNSGPKAKKSCELNTVPPAAELYDNIERQLIRLRDSVFADMMVKTGMGALELHTFIKEHPEMIAPSYFTLEQKLIDVQKKMAQVRLLAAPDQSKLLQISNMASSLND